MATEEQSSDPVGILLSLYWNASWHNKECVYQPTRKGHVSFNEICSLLNLWFQESIQGLFKPLGEHGRFGRPLPSTL